MGLCTWRRVAAWLKDCRGTNLIEAAFVTPLLLLLTFGIVDFSGVFYGYLALENGVSQATRFGITGEVLADPNQPKVNLSRVDSIKLAMRRATPTMTIPDAAFTFSHLPEGQSVWLAGTGGPNDVEKVMVTYDWELMTPLIGTLFPKGHLTLKVSSAMKNEPRFQ